MEQYDSGSAKARGKRVEADCMKICEAKCCTLLLMEKHLLHGHGKQISAASISELELLSKKASFCITEQGFIREWDVNKKFAFPVRDGYE